MNVPLLKHILYSAASSGSLKNAVRSLCREYPSQASLIRACCKQNLADVGGTPFTIETVDRVAKAFIANRKALAEGNFSAIV